MWKFVIKVFISCKTCRRFLNISPQIELRGKGVDLKTKLVYGGDLPVPIPQKSVGSMLFERLMKPDRKNEIFQVGATTNREMTAGECVREAVAFAEKLRSEGVNKGDYVILVGKNSINMNTALIGIFFLGVIPVPLSPETNIDEFKIIVEFVKPKFFACDKDDLFIFRQALRETSQYNYTRIFLLDQSNSNSETHLKNFPEFISGWDKNWEYFKPTDVENVKEEVALIMKPHSDGPEGRVFGITHYNINAMIARFDAKEFREKELWRTILMVQKVAWASGFYSLIVSCCEGQKLVVLSNFEEEIFGRLIDKHKVTTTFLFSSKLWQIYKYNYQGFDFSSCKYIHVVDGSLSIDLINGLKEKTGMLVRSCYGVTELTGLVLIWYPRNKLTSTGELIPATYGKVLSPKTGQKVGPNEKGELCFKGPTVGKGYLNNEKATKALFDKEGFVMTGHFGYYDADGDFFVLDRILHVIKYKDYNVSPRVIEGVIKSLDAVKDVCVVGIQHPEDGHVPIAFVSLQKNKKLTEEEIIAHVNEKVRDHEKLRGGVIFVKKIPRTRDTGAIKRALMEKVIGKFRYKSEGTPITPSQPPEQSSPIVEAPLEGFPPCKWHEL